MISATCCGCVSWGLDLSWQLDGARRFVRACLSTALSARVTAHINCRAPMNRSHYSKR